MSSRIMLASLKVEIKNQVRDIKLIYLIKDGISFVQKPFMRV